MRIYLVRHGESQGNVDKDVHREMADHAVPLSSRGHQQATAAGRFLGQALSELRDGPYDGAQPHVRLWVSPYRRTRETADRIEEGVAEAGGWVTDRCEHVLLCEQQFGLFDGVPDEELAELFPAEYAHYAKQEAFEGRFWARMPLGESRFDVATRVHQAFGTFHRDAERHGIEHLIVVCHGVTLRAFVMMWLHRSPEWFEDEPNPHNCAVRLVVGSQDLGDVFPGFGREG